MTDAEKLVAAPGAKRAASKRAPRRPKWLPEEFQTPQELVAAYKAERASAVEPAHTPRALPVDAPQYQGPAYPGDAAAPENIPEIDDAPQSEALDFSEFEREYCETGCICEDSYAKLERLGAPRWLVDRHIEGRRAVAYAARREILDQVGGEERFEAIQNWAREALPQAELDAFDEAIRGGKDKAKLAVLGLASSYAKAVGDAPRLVGGGAGSEGGPFASADDLAKAIRDPRYRSDPAYRDEVVARLAQRRVF